MGGGDVSRARTTGRAGNTTGLSPELGSRGEGGTVGAGTTEGPWAA